MRSHSMLIALASAAAILFGLGQASAQTADSYQSVVQVTSYTLNYGQYPQMLGWGSASVVDNAGLLVSNNHVVTDENGKEVDALGICVTTIRGSRPDCRYTAHILARDEIKDVSVLRIDSRDIYGNAVDFSLFQSFDMAEESEIPANQAAVTAIGYPWIGANTISETTGIVSGTIEYNGATYIKSDTTIAGGNSGGALLDTNGKLIGIPTFTIGEDASLGYALWIGEVRDFVRESASLVPATRDSDSAFRANLKAIKQANESGTLEDSLVTVNYPKNYELQNYASGAYIQIASTGENDSDLSGVMIGFMSIPKTKSDAEFLYLLENEGAYVPSFNKLKKTTVGGITMYEVTQKSGTDYSGYKNLFGRINDSTIAYISVSAPFYEEDKSDIRMKQYNDFLANIVFHGAGKKTPVFKIPDLGIEIAPSDSIGYSIYYGSATAFLGNLHEYFTMQFSKTSDYGYQPWSSFEDFAESMESNTYLGDTSRLKIGDMDGVVTCQTQDYSYSYGGSGLAPARDENGKVLPEMRNCTVTLYNVERVAGKAYMVTMSLVSEKANLAKNLDRTYAAIGRIFNVSVDVKSLPNSGRETATYSDIADQSAGYKKRIAWLVNHDLLPKKSMLLPNQPIMWGEFLEMYLQYMYAVKLPADAMKCASTDYACRFATVKLTDVYPDRVADEWNTKQTFADVFASLGIEYNKPVDRYLDNGFESAMSLELAGVDTSKLLMQDIWNLWQMSDKSSEFLKRIREVDGYVYRGERVLDYQVFGSYDSYDTENNCMLKVNTSGLIRQDCTPNKDKIRFNMTESLAKNLDQAATYKTRLSILNSSVCTDGSADYSAAKCLSQLNANERASLNETLETWDSLYVMSRADALDWFMGRMDFALFDEKLAKNKSGAVEPEDEESQTADQPADSNL